ncbi:MAG: hypothetical protein A2Y00_07280 [Omnitrophica WOR_2 bacterium GWF2_43_52]|nr:MAG: hypothetical protein A2062_07500 [Omnitrophica WOR_2 bacterium GWA2_44_7]OGX16667.1 MAG: hypothetical protein A2Y01_00955 [Omnitrophica WOR_2 bacterium GWC2_44_8]OGX20222.1 MAG: hypothetical protein A2Y00_07280 [Omnitrophica WOR_2 bacterium GWF2_43_52]OGX54484.1 MAG: hypothetical protein A2460_03145 [Omnitrophica WOR_2 bacterium RIFOXYC2_FULL_43_9]HAH20759.1 hypothetical protein [Candidatus Omnitrophota bacterium]
MPKNLRLKIADIVFSVGFPENPNTILLDKNYIPFKTNEKGRFFLTVKKGTGSFFEKAACPLFATPSWDYVRYQDKDAFVFFSSVRKKRWERVLSLNSEANRAEIMLPSSGKEKALTRNPFSYPLDEILTITLLSARCGSLIHSCGIRYKHKGYLFIGPSGAGKSTLSMLLKKNTNVDILSDDRVIVKSPLPNPPYKRGREFSWKDSLTLAGGGRVGEKRYFIYGTPWSGTAGIASPQSAPLSGLFFLKKAKHNSLTRLSYSDTASRLIQYSFLPFWDRERLNACLSVSEALSVATPAFEFSFTPDANAVDALRKEVLI